MDLSFFVETLRLGLGNLRLHKLRSFLTSLGIVIGVGAVIATLAIGEGVKRKTQREVEQLGATNIILRSVQPTDANRSSNRSSRVSVYGLKRDDVELIQRGVEQGIYPYVSRIVPLRDTAQEVMRGEVKGNVAAVATTPDLLKVANLAVESGRFLTPDDMDPRDVRLVCVLGSAAAQQLFGHQSPLGGEPVLIGTKVFDVVGVLKPVGMGGGRGSAMTGRDLNNDVYFPLSANDACFSDMITRRSAGSYERKVIELTEIYLKVDAAEHVEAMAAALTRLMDTRHADQADVKILVPRELLEQANESQRTFNYVMGGIAVLSLLVGGIGIMNISLATVTERTREIGIRRALGGKRRHIVMQFLIETTTLSVAGGIFGVVGGIGSTPLARVIGGESFPTYVTLWSVLVSFMISVGVGILFGVYPAVVAAHKDPIEALRHD